MSDDLRFSTELFDELAAKLDILLSGANPNTLLGPELTRLTARIPSSEQVTPGALARLSLLNDALCVAERAVRKDGQVSEAELAYVEPLARETHKYLSRVRSFYRDTVDLDRHGIGNFLGQHANDTQQFGGKCKTTAWLGLGLCQRASTASGDQHYIEQYRDIVARTVDDLFDTVGSGTSGQKQEIVDELNKLLPSPRATRDRREAVYCSPDSPEVFHAVAHGAEVFDVDPFDVESIHADARLAFTRLVDRAADAKFGKILLVKGEAGSGKTHLMRAFRNKVHGEQIGFVGYLQMSTRVSSYSRYLLSNVIDSWDRPFWGSANPDAGLLYLSDAVVSSLPPAKAEALRDDTLSEQDLHDLVNYAVDALLEQPRFRDAEVDLLRMMLYLQRREPTRRARVLKFLRCEPMNNHDRGQIGGVYPIEGDEGPPRMLTALGKLVWMTGNGALVLLVDQLEDVYNLDDAAKRFRLAMDTLRFVTDSVPTSVVVIACLEDFYDKLRTELNKPLLERIELDPEPVRLTAGRTLDEIEEVVGLRVSHLFESKNVVVREDEPLYPFKHEELAARVQHRTRDVLDWCRQHHEASIAAGKITSPKAPGPKPVVDPNTDRTIALSQAWNDHKANAETPPDDEPALLALLGWAVGQVPREHGSTERVTTTRTSTYLEVSAPWTKVSVGLCENRSAGGALGKQVEALIEHASERQTLPVALRSSEFPPPGRTKIAQLLKGLLQMGGRRIVIPNAEWRSIAALRSFCELKKDEPSLEAWLASEQPLSKSTSIRELLDLDASNLRNTVRPQAAAAVPSMRPHVAPAATHPASSPPTGPAVRPPSKATEDFVLGQTRGLAPHPVLINPSAFVTHAAFLGSSGSGKTTLALAIIENLLAQGVPVVMIDRKGDLGTYARPQFWKAEPSGAEAAELFHRLRDGADVRVYTPGEPRGRPLTLPVIPSDLGDLPGHERGIAARYAASALGAMMGYKKAKTDDTRLGILGKAIELVGRASADSAPGIGHLVSVLDEEDPELVALVGKLDTKHFRALVENLETLRLRYEHLLRDDGERLSPELLFGMDGSSAGRTRLSVVSTKFLGDNAAIDFWIARLLGELSRWASRSPASGLQGIVFLDEADIYLPAQSKPATKEPMLDLLKRARSAGLGVFLATQSPGDLDYRCRDNIRTWFVGRVAEKTAIEKMKPLLNEARVNVSTKLPTAKVGEFFKLQDGDVVEIKAGPSLMKTVQMSEDEIVQLAGKGK
jgi:hypothetical protein